jgi:hypothetical protein
LTVASAASHDFSVGASAGSRVSRVTCTSTAESPLPSNESEVAEAAAAEDGSPPTPAVVVGRCSIPGAETDPPHAR